MEDNTQTFEAFIEKYKSALDTLLIITKERQEAEDRRKARVEGNKKKSDPADISGGLSEDERVMAKLQMSSIIDNEISRFDKMMVSPEEMDAYRECQRVQEVLNHRYQEEVLKLKNKYAEILNGEIAVLNEQFSGAFNKARYDLQRAKWELMSGKKHPD